MSDEVMTETQNKHIIIFYYCHHCKWLRLNFKSTYLPTYSHRYNFIDHYIIIMIIINNIRFI